MALTLKVPPPAERQLTETKWDAAEERLRVTPALQTSDALLTPQHVYRVVREPSGTFSRVRTKSQEETNVDLVASPRPGHLRHVLVDNAGTATRTDM
jgi:hypothetical protein